MFITGYHGTTRYSYNKMLETGNLQPSTGDKEWLGSGIYFYCKYEDALDWAKRARSKMEIETGASQEETAPVVIHAIIEIPDNKTFWDFDTGEGKEIFETTCEMLRNDFPELLMKTAQVNQCTLANYIWNASPEVALLMCSFPTVPRGVPLIADLRRKRKEFCIRDNSSIFALNIVERWPRR